MDQSKSWDAFRRQYCQQPHSTAYLVITTLLADGLFVFMAVAVIKASLEPGAVGIAAGIVGAVFLVVPYNVYVFVDYIRTRSRVEEWVIRLDDGTEYPYLCGDTLSWYEGQGSEARLPLSGVTGLTLSVNPRHFRGLVVQLPVELPQIYLDARRDIGRITPYVIDSSQRIDLEGEFSSSFRMYAPHGAEVETLAVFQPDVMQTILNYQGNYDVEIYRDSLRIIARQAVYGQLQRQQELKNIAQAILSELQPRLRRWQQHPPDTAAVLAIYRYRGLRLGRRYLPFRLWVLAGFSGLPAIVLVAIAVGTPLYPGIDTRNTVAIALLFACLFGIPACIALYAAIGRSRIVT